MTFRQPEPLFARKRWRAPGVVPGKALGARTKKGQSSAKDGERGIRRKWRMNQN
jgi:hypothetical protein